MRCPRLKCFNAGKEANVRKELASQDDSDGGQREGEEGEDEVSAFEVSAFWVPAFEVSAFEVCVLS